MNPKEIIISTSILIILLVGFYFLIRNRSSNKDPEELQNQSELETLEVMESSGFEKRAESNNLNAKKDEKKMPEAKKLSAPQMLLKENTDYKAVIKTSMGNMTFDLFEKLSPKTVNNFVYLAREGFYDGVIFHRVIDDFMIQTGDPTGTGMGGPGYSFEDEINKEKLVKGSLAMANAGPNTNGSQFFVVTKASTPWLDGAHTNFGKITEGLDVAEKIQKVKTDRNDKPLEKVTITSVEIIEESKQ